MTCAISVVVERSPSGLRGWLVSIGPTRTRLRGSDFAVLGWVRSAFEAIGMRQKERGRVLQLLIAELGPRGRRRAEVTAEISVAS